MLDKIQLFGLIVKEMMVFVGGMCMFGINYGESKYGVFIDNVGVLSIDFFVNFIDMKYIWKLIGKNSYVIVDRVFGDEVFIVMCFDLVFGLNFVLCVYVELYV